MANLYAQDLSLDDFLKIIREASWPDGSLMIAFSPAEARLNFFHFDEAFIKASEQGRIFFSGGEFKWRRVDGQFRSVYLGGWSPPFELTNYSDSLTELHTHLDELILWGIRTDLQDEWIELQVPQRFGFPLKSKDFSQGRVALLVENWLDSSGMPQFSRYHSLKEVKGESHATG